MKWLLTIFLGLLLVSCDYYEEFFDDANIIPIGSKSLLVTKSAYEIENIFLENGFQIYSNDNGYETEVRMVRDIGYFKCEFNGIMLNKTRIRILYSKDDYKNLKYLNYNDDNTRMIYNHIITLLEENGISGLYYEE